MAVPVVLTFRNLEIRGIVTKFTVAKVKYEPIRNKFVGVRGISELATEPDSRPIIADVLIYDDSFYARLDVRAWLDQLDERVGLNGDLRYDGTGPSDPFFRVFRDCTFEGFEQSPRGELQDVASTLPNATAGSQLWFTMGTLSFTQLTPP